MTKLTSARVLRPSLLSIFSISLRVHVHDIACLLHVVRAIRLSTERQIKNVTGRQVIDVAVAAR